VNDPCRCLEHPDVGVTGAAVLLLHVVPYARSLRPQERLAEGVRVVAVGGAPDASCAR
jgi:hypothetical protein